MDQLNCGQVTRPGAAAAVSGLVAVALPGLASPCLAGAVAAYLDRLGRFFGGFYFVFLYTLSSFT